MDLLAAITSDPTVVPLWAVLLFAVGMYPVGMLFGCSACCQSCRRCCRDYVEQVVVDFSLAGDGEHVVAENGFTITDMSNFSQSVDTSTNGYRQRAPVLIAEGDTSGARAILEKELIPGTEVDGFLGEYSLFRVRTFVDGPDDLAHISVAVGTVDNAWEDGETVTITGRDTTTVEAAVATVRLAFAPEACAYRPELVVTNPGQYAKVAAADLRIDCLADEGSVIFDVSGQIGTEPEPCSPCQFTVARSVYHPASYRLNECGYGVGGADERSFLSVAVGLTASGPQAAYLCSLPRVATVETDWIGIGGSNCNCETTYTIDPDQQDCIPFSAWTSSSSCACTPPITGLVSLAATSCWGSGFAGQAVQPSGQVGVDEGPITEVEITNPGSGYAVLGRVAPTISVGGGTGSGATFSVTLAEENSLNPWALPAGCESAYIPQWRIQSVAVTAAGTGYVNGQALTATVSSPGVEVLAASLTVTTLIEEPTLTASVAGGSGASLAITYDEWGAAAEGYWKVASVSVTSGGTGYTDGTAVDFTLGTGDVAYLGVMPTATVTTTRAAPTLGLFGGTGTSAVLSVSVASNGTTPATWGISSVTITDGGAGYLANDILDISLGSGDVETDAATVRVATVDGSGAILTISIDDAGDYWNDTGVIASVTVDFQAFLQKNEGKIDAVVVNTVFGATGGIYYEEDASEPAIVADVTVTITQQDPSDGTGAEITATVDDDPASDTFGQIVGLTIDDGGTGYIAGLDGVGIGPGGYYASMFSDCGLTYTGPIVTRACPDYTAEITLQ